LPVHAYEYTDIRLAKVNIDYHIHYDRHLYSVPHHLVGERVEIHASATLVKIFFKHRSIASHPSKHRPGTTTLTKHMPERHQKDHQWTPGRLMNWAKDIGDETLIWIKRQLASKAHEEQAYRVCLGLLNLSKRYPQARLEAACGLANRQSLDRLKQINGILQSNQDRLYRKPSTEEVHLPQSHENIRGPQSFH